MSETPDQRFVREVVEKAGGQSAVARHFGLKQQSVYDWICTGRVPAERVIGLEQMSGVPRHRIRGDIYPLESRSRRSEQLSA